MFELDLIQRQLPSGRKLPKNFGNFLRIELRYLRVQWNDLDDFEMKPSAKEEAVPFLKLPDGGIITLWYHSDEPAIVHFGSEGELKVIASDFDQFQRAVNSKCTGLPDFDEDESIGSVPGVTGNPDNTGLPELQGKFTRWHAQHTALLKPLISTDAEQLRQNVHKIATEMIRDGCCKVYTPQHSWWSMTFRIERNGNDRFVTYLTYGKWYPVPEQYVMSEAVRPLLDLVVNKDRPSYELSVLCVGIVSIDRDRELCLVPPESSSASVAQSD